MALPLGAILGCFGKQMGFDATKLKWISDLVMRILRLLATPLIFSAVLSSIITANVSGKKAGRLMFLLASNSVVAILVGLLVANSMRPGSQLHLSASTAPIDNAPYNIWQHLYDSVPKNFLTPFIENDMIGIILLAVTLGFAMRILIGSTDELLVRSFTSLRNVLNAVFQMMVTVLTWVFELVPFAVFAVVAATVADKGLSSLLVMGYWVVSVVLALTLMMLFYLGRLRIQSNVRPMHFLRGSRDAFVMAFSTASSAATLPVTYRCAVEKLGVRDDNANLGIMVGGTFNHDGTALY